MKRIFTLGLMMLTASLMFGQATRTIDFEYEGTGADWTWTVVANDDNPELEILENPDYDDVNESERVAKFIARAAGDPWALIVNGSDNGEFTFDADNCIVKLMVNKPLTSDIGFKVEGGTGTVTTVIQANTLVDEWEEVTFDFTEVIGQTYSGFVIMPSNISRTEDITCYLDNIQLPGFIHEAPVVTDIPNIILGVDDDNELITLTDYFASEDLLTYEVSGAVNTSAIIAEGILTVSPLTAGTDVLTVTATTPFNKSASDEIMVIVTGTSAVEFNSIMDFTVAPNPSNGQFTIQLANDNSLETEVTIFNVAGQVAHQQMVSSSFSDINVSELNTGLYYLQISNLNGKNLKKIMIK